MSKESPKSQDPEAIQELQNTSPSALGKTPTTQFLGVAPLCAQCLNGLECEAHDQRQPNHSWSGASRSKCQLQVALLSLPDREEPKKSLSITSVSTSETRRTVTFSSLAETIAILCALLFIARVAWSVIESLINILIQVFE
jgi:hypothetical protein